MHSEYTTCCGKAVGDICRETDTLEYSFSQARGNI